MPKISPADRDEAETGLPSRFVASENPRLSVFSTPKISSCFDIEFNLSDSDSILLAGAIAARASAKDEISARRP